jgi:hypothetical protein
MIDNALKRLFVQEGVATAGPEVFKLPEQLTDVFVFLAVGIFTHAWRVIVNYLFMG